jgi:hemoglobin
VKQAVFDRVGLLMAEQSLNYGTGDASFQAAGGVAGLTRLVDRFYHYMDVLPEAQTIRNMHDDDLTLSKEKLVCFLSGWLGGPRTYAERYGQMTIPGAHRHLNVGEAERDAWMLCMAKAVDEQPYEASFKTYLLQQLSFPAERVRVVCSMNNT